jgi:hypothetical protein
MNKKISAGTAAIVIAVALAVCGFVYSRIPTGMVVNTTGKMGKRGRGGGPPTMRNHPGLQRAPHGIPQKATVLGKDSHPQKSVAKEAQGTESKTAPHQ